MTYLTFEQAQEVHRTIADDTVNGGKVIYPSLRRWAADQLLADDWPADEGMGTSDISIALTERLRFFEAPAIGPVLKAYAACGIAVPEYYR